MQGYRAETGAVGTICSEPKSESDIKSGAATAPRKVVSNSYQTYRTTSGMKWTNFRRSLLWISRSSRHRHPEKGDPIPFKTVNACLEHSIWFPCDRIMQLASFDKKIIVLLNGLPFIYLPDLHLTCELSKFEVKISFELLQLSPTPISLKFAATLYPTLV